MANPDFRDGIAFLVDAPASDRVVAGPSRARACVDVSSTVQSHGGIRTT